MAARVKSFGWENTSLGAMDSWPQALITTLGIVLNSRQPMVLMWGEDLIQFYNDAFIPSLGNQGKHPTALGQPVADSWPETWSIIGPLVNSVKTTGEPVYYEDQLLPIFRNGRMEEAYWTFSYSAVYDETGARAGVLTVCSETTTKVTTVRKLLETQNLLTQSENNLRNIILQAPVPMCIFIGPEHVVEIANEKMFEFWGKNEDEVLHKPIFDALPEATNQGFERLLNSVYRSGKSYSAYGAPVTLPRGGKTETVYVNFVYEALRREEAIIGVMAVALDVTEQVLATKRIADSEQKFRSVVHEATIAMAVLEGPNMVLQLVNEAMLEIWGRDHSIIGKELLEFLPELIDQPFPRILQEVYTTGQFYSASDAFVKLIKNGVAVVVYMDFSYKVLRNTDGEIYAILVMAQDVTPRVEAARALKRSQDELQMAIQIADLGTFYIDKATYAASYSPRVGEWFGFDVQDNISQIIDFVEPEDRERVIRSIDETFQKGVPHDITYRTFNPKTKEKRYIRSIGQLQRDENGEPVGMLGTLQDVSQDINARKRIEESERNLRSIILQAPVAMCILLGPFHIVDVANEAMINIWGKPKEKVMGKPVFEALPDARQQGLEQLLDDVFHTGIPITANERPVRLIRNGKAETIYQNFVYQPYKDPAGKILGVLAISNDVTDQVLARMKIEDIVAERTKELAETNARLKASNSQLEQFAYIASHDLQEPARKITTFAELVLNSYTDEQLAKRYIEKIAGASNRMLALIRDILAFSQVRRDKRLFSKVDLNEVMESIKGDFELLIEQKRARIIHNQLPVIDGIPVQLQQLFANLISNSLKFVPNNRTPMIEVLNGVVDEEDIKRLSTPRRAEAICKLVFRDNGIGFGQEHADQIFDIFQRLHGKFEFEGTGIGLAICRRIAENHGGAIFATSRPGKGAEFIVLLPLAQQ